MKGLALACYRLAAVLMLLSAVTATPAPRPQGDAFQELNFQEFQINHRRPKLKQPQQPAAAPTQAPAVSPAVPIASAPAAPTAAPAAANEPCAQIDAATLAFKAANPQATPRVPAALAHDCLQTVPNKVGPAQDLIRSLKNYVNWQSTLAFLKAPPASYMLPPTDIQGGLDLIASNAQQGKYKSEFDFQISIVELFATAHDGHFAFRPDIFKAFGFRNNLASKVATISIDGKQAPKIYTIDSLSNMTSGSTMPAAITMINGQDITTAIEAINLKFSNFQDPDSQWNAQMPNYASPLAGPFFGASLGFLGPSVTLTFEDGRQQSEESFAIIRAGANFSGVNSGEDFYNRFCNPDAALADRGNIMMMPATPTMSPPTTNTTTTKETSPVASPTVRVAPAPTIEGYPLPFIRDSGANVTAGYFLDGLGYDKVAVLSVKGFSPEGDFDGIEYLTNFQETVGKFLAESKAQGKEKLLIDVTGNGGGFVVAGYDLFAQVFPEIKPFQANNLRLSDSLINMARISDSIFSMPNLTEFAMSDNQRAALSALFNSEVVSNLIPGSVFSPLGDNFTSVEEILAPVSLRGDTFTAYQSTPLNQTASDFNLTGTGNRANPPPAVFKPENVVLLTDGTCGSTCTLMSYLMIEEANVKTTVVGGRPQLGPMQSIAGVEGAQVFPLESIATAARAALTLAPAERVAELQGTEIFALAEAYALTRAAVPGTAGAVNGKNAFSPTNAQIPLQFLYQPANCRFFYTKDSFMDPVATWKMAVDASWNRPEEFCVQGSRVETNSTVGAPMDPLFRLSTTEGGLAVSGAAGVGVGGGKMVALAVVLGLVFLI